MNLDLFHNIDYYVNSGFLSLSSVYFDFLDLWESIIDKCSSLPYVTKLYAKGEISNTRGSGRWDPFQALDQDALNIALMCYQSPISILGPDIMGFTTFGLIPHAIGRSKPWQRIYLVYAVKGYKPRPIDRAFWSYANYPLRNYSSLHFILKKIDLFISLLLTRFFKV